MQTVPSLFNQLSQRMGDPYSVLFSFDFDVTNLAAGATKQKHVALNKNTAMYIDSLTCSYPPTGADIGEDGGVNPLDQESEYLVNIFDSRNLVRWFLPDPLPLSLAFGYMGSRQFKTPTAFYVPAGQDLLMEFTNKSASTITTRIDFVLSGQLVGIPTGSRNGI